MTRSEEAQALKILKEWALEFHNYGDKWDCIEIRQDGCAEDDDGNQIEHEPCYAIFINRNSHLLDEFPKHQTTNTSFGLITHRRPDDYCAYVWINEETSNIDINTPDADEGHLTWDEAIKIILAIDKKFTFVEDK